MKNQHSHRNYSTICKHIFLLVPLIATLPQISFDFYSPFIFISLILIANTQLRKLLAKTPWMIVSILLEMGLVSFLSLRYGGFTYLVLFATLADILFQFKIEAVLLTPILATNGMYLLYSTHSLEWILIIGLFFVGYVLLFIEMKREHELRMDTESLYDQLRKSNYELEAARARLLDYSKQVEKVVQLEERNRISRELHDSIGHSLTGILMQVDATIQILSVDYEKGKTLLQSAYDNINTSIETVRKTVRKLKPSSYQSHQVALRELIEKFGGDTGVKVKLSTEGAHYELFPSVETTLYQNTQEALTNALRHGRATEIDIHLVYHPHAIEMRIVDNGKGTKVLNKGFGLSGMEERMELVGGQIFFTSTKGFEVNMRIPRREVE